MKSKSLWILLGVIVVLGAAFMFLNFRLAVNKTSSEKNLITTGIGDQMPSAIQRRDKISIALVGEGPFVNMLQKALAAEMRNADLGDIEFVQGPAPTYQNPVLVVQMGKMDLLWTPLFATSQFSVNVGYDSSGDTTFMGKNPIVIDNQNGSNLNVYGEYIVRDRSWGLISRPGYHQILADYLAQQIAAVLKDLYKAS
jgi:hypothetical protein